MTPIIAAIMTIFIRHPATFFKIKKAAITAKIQ